MNTPAPSPSSAEQPIVYTFNRLAAESDLVAVCEPLIARLQRMAEGRAALTLGSDRISQSVPTGCRPDLVTFEPGRYGYEIVATGYQRSGSSFEPVFTYPFSGKFWSTCEVDPARGFVSFTRRDEAGTVNIVFQFVDRNLGAVQAPDPGPEQPH